MTCTADGGRAKAAYHEHLLFGYHPGACWDAAAAAVTADIRAKLSALAGGLDASAVRAQAARDGTNGDYARMLLERRVLWCADLAARIRAITGDDTAGGRPVRQPAAAGRVPMQITTAGGRVVPLHPENCEPHTPQPDGYADWQEWAEQMAQTHVQRQCRGCGLLAVWEPKPARQAGHAPYAAGGGTEGAEQ